MTSAYFSPVRNPIFCSFASVLCCSLACWTIIDELVWLFVVHPSNHTLTFYCQVFNMSDQQQEDQIVHQNEDVRIPGPKIIISGGPASGKDCKRIKCCAPVQWIYVAGCG